MNNNYTIKYLQNGFIMRKVSFKTINAKNECLKCLPT